MTAMKSKAGTHTMTQKGILKHAWCRVLNILNVIMLKINQRRCYPAKL